jgi:hypothetical protein
MSLVAGPGFEPRTLTSNNFQHRPRQLLSVENYSKWQNKRLERKAS